MIADGGETISDLGVVRDQPELFGAVASTATAWRVLAAADADTVRQLRATSNNTPATEWVLDFDPHRSPAFVVEEERDAAARDRKMRADVKANRDRFQAFVLESCQGKGRNETAGALSKAFPTTTESSHRSNLSRGAYGVRQDGDRWRSLGSDLCSGLRSSRVLRPSQREANSGRSSSARRSRWPEAVLIGSRCLFVASLRRARSATLSRRRTDRLSAISAEL